MASHKRIQISPMQLPLRHVCFQCPTVTSHSCTDFSSTKPTIHVPYQHFSCHPLTQLSIHFLAQNRNLGTNINTSLSWHNHFIPTHLDRFYFLIIFWVYPLFCLYHHCLSSLSLRWLSLRSLYLLLVSLHLFFHIAAMVIFPEHKFNHVTLLFESPVLRIKFLHIVFCLPFQPPFFQHALWLRYIHIYLVPQINYALCIVSLLCLENNIPFHFHSLL